MFISCLPTKFTWCFLLFFNVLFKGSSVCLALLSHSPSTLVNLQHWVSQCSGFANLFHRNLIYKNNPELLGLLICHRVLTMKVAWWVTLWGIQVLTGTEWNHEVPGRIHIFLFLSSSVPRKMKCFGFILSCGDIKNLLAFHWKSGHFHVAAINRQGRSNRQVRIPKQTWQISSHDEFICWWK